MIKTADRQQVRVRERLRGGEGALVFHDLLTQEESFGAGKLFSRTVIPPGASIGTHTHEGEFEMYYLLSGDAEVLDGGEWSAIRRGDVHVCANGEAHAIRNNTATEAEVLMLILFDQTARA